MKLWQTRVYQEDGLLFETYWFREKADVVSSVITSWSKNPDLIRRENMEGARLLWTWKSNSNVAVEAQPIDFVIQERATHL